MNSVELLALADEPTSEDWIARCRVTLQRTARYLHVTELRRESDQRRAAVEIERLQAIGKAAKRR